MFDAIVVGGGLAGCSAAITLARGGHQVALIEAASYPRAKVCGEFLSPECVTLFAGMGFLDSLQALHPATIRTLRITAPGGGEWRGAFPAPASSVSRYALDHALVRYAAACGVTVATGTRVTQIDGGFADGFTVTTHDDDGSHALRAASVIAAYGKRSTLDRVLQRDFFGQAQPYMGLKQHFRGAPLPEHIDLHVFHGGYCGISQVEDGRTNVCLMVEQAVFQAVTAGAPDAIARFVAWMSADNPHLGGWLADATPLYPHWLSIAQVTLAPKTPLEGDILCAGDAAGMVAPLAGDGMAMALHSGILAADRVHDYLTHQADASAVKRRYADEWRRTFAARLRLGRALQSLILRPAILTPGLRVMRTFPALGNWLVNNTRDMRLVERTIS
ncbi:MAG: NAD(P)/FAD-dependent oxidoreductase [Chloroflexota bacterium]|nr:NAD(P)/FAD-dependent oxidoreductase [Chloroflexota bacterium]